jgi:GAF domain-containing protein/ANTAR domain-containing protein
MTSNQRMREAFAEAVDGVEPGLAMADRLCHACVDLLDVDGAAISLIHAGLTHGTYGASSELSRQLDEYQFTFGEGPCLDSVREARPVLVADLQDPGEQRWPGYAGATLAAGVRAVYALPVALNLSYVGVLDLFRTGPGRLNDAELRGGLLAAQLAALPMLDLISGSRATAHTPGDSWSQLDALQRIEVYQATGMIMGQLGVGPAEALIRLRAHAFAHSMTPGELAWQIIARRVTLESDAPPADPGGNPGTGP